MLVNFVELERLGLIYWNDNPYDKEGPHYEVAIREGWDIAKVIAPYNPRHVPAIRYSYSDNTGINRIAIYAWAMGLISWEEMVSVCMRKQYIPPSPYA